MMIKNNQNISAFIRRLIRLVKFKPNSIADKNYQQQINLIADGCEETKRIISDIFLKNNHTTVDKVFAYLWENNITGSQEFELFYYCECDGNPNLMIKYIALTQEIK